LLTGKHTDVGSVVKGRFKNNENYLPRFYTPSNFEALQLISQQCEKDNMSMVDATFQWLLNHSALDAKIDGFLLGASSVSQLEQNLSACTRAASPDVQPLSSGLLNAFDEAWEATKDGAFPYWRSYSSDMPHRETLDPGASYNAAKTTKS
jgi:aflatoxin B1 aldehyde reductase